MADQPPPSYQDSAYPQKPGAPYPTQPNPGYPTQQGGAVYPATSYTPAGQPPPAQPYVSPPQGTAYNAGQSTVIVAQPTIAIAMHPRYQFGYIPQSVTCQFCHKQTVTRTQYVNGGATWLACGITALVGCFCGCCLIPFCIDGCKDVHHFCGECGQIVGLRKRLD